MVKIEREWRRWSRGTEALSETVLVHCWLDFISHLRLANIVGQSSPALIALYVSTLQGQSGNTSGIAHTLSLHL